ncbi:hypothetical protein MK805_06305 [Shimazuella sp. AN120528]|uniref:hypothetical protein n=1 Tax=Shimazuella soli TaxID=1892854 RepID=UPI001F10D87B|nr:hypothetical protein [Shimazuella soli]MCH5584580.1 hypothetical protein [Shimazuella soli]
MMKTVIIIGLILVIAPVILIFRFKYDQIEAALQRTKDKIISLMPRWIRGK